MDKKLLFGILLISVFLIGCASEQVKQTPEVQEGNTQDAPQKVVTAQPKTTITQTQQQEPAKPELSEEEKAKLESKLDISSKFMISQNFRTMGVGDSYTFGLGVTNAQPTSFYFKTVFGFDKAVDSSSNKLQGVDAETVLGWLNEQEFMNQIESYESAMWPVVVKVGKEMGPGVLTKPGTYTFEIRTYYNDVETPMSKEYSAKNTLTIRVK